ncbi:ribonuclease H-like domain-containing protein, partial [Tanacetum coccineum]
AFITKIVNMPLTDYFTLFGVLVFPEYCISLMSIHKVARDSKLVIAFDELKCYILNQDLKAGKVLGLSTWHCRLGHPADQVLNVLRPNLLFENDKSDVMCETCQRAKHTREPFPLSDHISTELGVGSTSGIRACALRNFDLEVMELENTQNNALAKLPMLKLGEYKMWEIRIKQYFQIQDYTLWEVIENGNSWVPIPVTASETGPSKAAKMTVPSTAEEKTCKKNDVKARSLLLTAKVV